MDNEKLIKCWKMFKENERHEPLVDGLVNSDNLEEIIELFMEQFEIIDINFKRHNALLIYELMFKAIKEFLESSYYMKQLEGRGDGI